MILEVEPATYSDAADVLLSANQGAATRYGDLVSRLAALSGIAGNPDWAGGWSSTYDDAAAAAVRTYADVVSALAGLQRLTGTSARNHAAADRGSVLSLVRPAVYTGAGGAVPSGLPLEVNVRPLPTVSGGTGDGPWWWSKVRNELEGVAWPDADTDGLRRAARCWHQAGGDVEILRSYVDRSAALVARQRSPETAMAVAAHDRVTAAVEALAVACHDLGDSCRRHADDVEEHRSTVLHLGAEIAAETVAIQAASHLLAIPTFGASEAVGQTAQALRLAAAITKIRAALAALSATLALRLAPIRAVSVVLAKETPGLRRIADARVISTSPSIEAATQASSLGLTRVSPGVFSSPAGLIYGAGKREHRLTHVLLHAYADGTKSRHALFGKGADVLRTIDDAWVRRGDSVDKGGKVFEVALGRIVGTRGESRVRIVVRKGSSKVVSAYPIH